MERNIYKIGKELFVTNDEEIKDGEYGICLNLVREGFKSHQPVFKMDAEQRQAMEELGGQKKAEVLKVILTTDQDLINDGVQAIDDEFLKWFVKNPSCEFVHLGFTSIIGDLETKRTYKIIIPKEEPKQETLEEVAERLFPIYMELGNCTIEHDSNEELRDAFIDGAKWQQQQNKNLYSEEEFLAFGKSCFYKGFEKSEKDDANCYTAFREEIGCLIEQFKKK